MKKSTRYSILLVVAAASFIFIPSAWTQMMRVDSVVNVGSPINSAGDDFSPSFTSDGKVMIFNSKRGQDKYQDIYISFFESNAWSDPRPIDEINSSFNDETPYITPDAGFIFFASDRDGSQEMQGARPGEVLVSYDIYVSKNLGNSWAKPIRLPGAVNTPHHERSPSLSPDLQTIYYTTWPFGDITRAYIMKADYLDGEFVNPTALPSPVNVRASDTGPMPSPDGKGLYFSSLRPGGQGGWDIWYVAVDKSVFGTPVNLGTGVNSKYNEVQPSFAGNAFYFCSNRPGGQGLYDIYAAGILESGIKVIVRDKKTGAPLSVEMNIASKIRKSEDETLARQVKKRTDARGEALLKPGPGEDNMEIGITEKGYLPLFKELGAAELKGEPLLLELVPIEKNARFDVHAIHFDFESSRITPESFPYLDALAAFLHANPTIRFEITGHTDLQGEDTFNDRLSLERAQAVKDYLVGRGIDGVRFTVRGAGKREPLVSRQGEEYDRQNRRTEFKVLEK
jgi:outer membrane protein OmpA-like peptidoglycan-associated protein